MAEQDTEDSISKLEPLVLKEDGSRDESVSMKNNTHPVKNNCLSS